MTLIEILIALIVMVLGVLGILALFPPALQSGTESMEETNASILAESVAHALTSAMQGAEEDRTAATLKLRATLVHDLKAPPAAGALHLHPAPAPHQPDDGPGLVPLSGHEGSRRAGRHSRGRRSGSKKMASTKWEPEEDDRHFQLGGDQYVVNSVQSVHDVNDPTDPLTQFAFSFDIRKVDDMWYQRRNPGAIDPYKNQALKPEEYESMEKLYEVQIHVLRISNI